MLHNIHVDVLWFWNKRTRTCDV